MDAVPGSLRPGPLLVVDLLAGGVLILSVAWLTLPDPLPLASGWPETTAYMELRRAHARAEGRPVDLARTPVPLAAISRPVRRAVIVAEDAAFYRHRGVDWSEVRTAIRDWWSDDDRLRGASTLTMQLARNLYLSPDRSWIRKARETLLAYRLEARLSKPRILELYLNVVELGPDVFGVEAAARHYWGLPASSLGPRRAAELAATLPSPLEDNPATRTRRFRWRAGLIFERAFGERPADAEVPEPGRGPGDGEPAPGGADTIRPPLPSPDTAGSVPDTSGAGSPRPDTARPASDTAGPATDTVPATTGTASPGADDTASTPDPSAGAAPGDPAPSPTGGFRRGGEPADPPPASRLRRDAHQPRRTA